ncbi:rhomboid family intramembrane serine protease [Aquirufa sp. HETE-83D]|jgi:membrane associated rhomboid family serine protease|uniref:Rhomboid family intramembrane serine protease n=1 Tax=Aquirufa esocilacus TaxID=3096513 RepID=A0ABW6DR04_9BACT
MLRDLTPTVKKLLIVNIVLFFVSAFIPKDLFALHFIQSPKFHYFQFITYMFLHGSLMHLFFNMFGLYMFGSILERLWGGPRFLFFFIFCGIGGGILHEVILYFHDFKAIRDALEGVISNPNSEYLKKFFEDFSGGAETNLVNNNVTGAIEVYKSKISADEYTMVGASGGVVGALMAYAYIFPNTEMFIFPIPIPLKAKYLVMVLAFYELYAGKTAIAGDNVAHFAHLGGMLFAVILLLIWRQRRDFFY